MGSIERLRGLGSTPISKSSAANSGSAGSCRVIRPSWFYFRRRIWEDGVRMIFEISVTLYGEKAKEKEVVVDSTVQVAIFFGAPNCCGTFSYPMFGRYGLAPDRPFF